MKILPNRDHSHRYRVSDGRAENIRPKLIDLETALVYVKMNVAFLKMCEPIITEFFDNEEEMAKFQKWREEYEEKERLEKEEKAKRKWARHNLL